MGSGERSEGTDAAWALVDLLVETAAPAGRDEMAAARRRLLAGLARAVGADTWSWVLARVADPGDASSPPVPVTMLDGGWTPQQRGLHVRAQQSPHRRIFTVALYDRLVRDGQATLARPAVLDDVAWRASAFFKEFTEPMGLEEFLLSARRIDPAGADISGLGLYRTAGKPPFGATQVAIVEAFMTRVSWLHERSNTGTAEPILTLTPRAREVLQLLRMGHPDKTIAEMLDISRHTVGGHVKTILRRFNVGSRSELQAKFLAGDATA